MALHKNSVKVVSMNSTVRLIYYVMPNLIIAGAQASKSEYDQFEGENVL